MNDITTNLLNYIEKDGELDENFENLNKCIKKSLNKLIKSNDQIIKKWNICGEVDCKKEAIKEYVDALSMNKKIEGLRESGILDIIYEISYLDDVKVSLLTDLNDALDEIEL